MTHIKQILFIDQNIYISTRDKDKDYCYDILIDLPSNSNITKRKD